MIPKEVISLAQNRIELGGKVVKVSERYGYEVYTCKFDERTTIGLPELYLWDGKEATTISGDDVFEWV